MGVLERSEKVLYLFMSKTTFYERIWQSLKLFPRILSQGSRQPLQFSGPAAAAFLSTGIGCWAMMITHHLADTSKEMDTLVWKIGSWIPGSHNPSKLWGNIGSYSGKQTVLLIGWLLSWFILHRLWRQKNISTKTIFLGMFFLFVVSTAMAWHPLFPYLHIM